MNVLLDTHAFLWFVGDDPRLSLAARMVLESELTRPFLSMASVWEMALKISLGKLSVGMPFETFILEQLASNGIALLHINLRHTAALIYLPFYHRDPFDRLLAVQAVLENMPFVSADPVFEQYPLKRVW